MKRSLLNQFKNLRANKKSITMLSAMLLFVFGLQQASAQVSSYQYAASQSAGLFGATLSTLGGATSVGFISLDNDVKAVPIGFTFKFNGVNYTACSASTNGFITFSNTAVSPAVNSFNPISGTELYDGAIAAYGRDCFLLGTVANTFYQTSGTAPNRVFTIQYNIRRTAIESTTIRAKIVLTESSNLIEVIHAARINTDIATTNFPLQTGQIGLRGTNNADFNNVSITQPVSTTPVPWTPTVALNGASNGNTNLSSCKTRGGTLAAGQPICLPLIDIKFTWTPVTCLAPTAVAAAPATLFQSTAIISWTTPAVAPGVGYEVFYTTSPTFPNAATTANGGTPPAGTNSATLTGLSADTIYYVYVRSDCGSGDISGWSAQATFRTRCVGVNVPYVENFNTTAQFAIPSCSSKQDPIFLSGDGVAPNYFRTWIVNNPSIPDYGFSDKHLYCLTGSATTSASYWYSAGINMTAGTTYKLSYKYGASRQLSGTFQNLQVYFSTNQVSSSIVSQLASHLLLRNSPLTNSVNFTPTTSGVYYIVFYDTTPQSNGWTMVDDIKVELSTCFPPTALIAANVSASAETLTWTAPSSLPSSGYEYYISTSNTAPTFATVISGVSSGNFITINGLLPSTTYYYWVRSNCGGDDKSRWSLTNGTFTTDPAPVLLTYCGGVNPASTVNTNYFTEVSTSGNTVNFSNFSNGYSLPSGYGDFRNYITTNVQGGTCNFSFTGNFTGLCGVAIWVDWNQNSVFDTNELVYASSGYLSGASTTVSSSFPIPVGATLGYTTMRVLTDFNASAATPVPIDPCSYAAVIKQGEIEDYTFQVKAAPPAITLSGISSTICAGESTLPVSITSLISNYTYSWSPTSVSPLAGNGPFVFNPISTTTYTLTGFNSSTARTTSVKYTVFVNKKPSLITVTPASAIVCAGQTPISLVGSGAVVSGSSPGSTVVFTEDFESAAPSGWTIINNNQVGPYQLATWHRETSGYVYGVRTFSSNDNTRFFMTNGDSQGSNIINDNVLTSPLIAIPSGFANCNLSFYHFLQGYTQGSFSAKIEVQLNGIGGWVLLDNYNYATAGFAEGTPSGFVNVILDMTPYLGQSVKIRFNHRDTWGYQWAIDNLQITCGPPQISWNLQSSPLLFGAVPGLYTSYTNAVTNTPYIVGNVAVNILALPSATTIYTANASAGSGANICSTQTSVTVTVNSLTPGTFTGAGQFFCGDATPADITISGNNGAIVKWQSSSTAAFTSFTDIATTSSTLTSANMGLIAATTYYRAVVLVGTCTFNTPPVVVTVLTTTWNGSTWSPNAPDINTKAIFNGPYTSATGLAGDLEACSVQVLSGAVVFSAGSTLTVENEVKVSGGSLTFNNTANLLQNNDAAINVGDITYKRTTKPMKRFDFTYWSSPVYKATNTLLALSPNTLSDKYFIWDTSLASYNWTGVPPTTTIMDKGVGYIVRAPQTNSVAFGTAFAGSFIGVPNNGIITTPISKSGTGNNELNLIGNPYPSDLFANAFINANTTIDGTLYFWTHNTPITANVYTPNDYAIYNLAGGVGTIAAPNTGVNNNVPNGYIAAGQSFFIIKLAIGTSALTFNNAMRQPGNTSIFYRGTNQTPPTVLEKHRFWLEMTNNQGAYAQSLIAYVEGATSAKDRLFDGLLFDESASISLYSVLNSDKLAIKGVGLPFNDQDTHQLGYISKVAETFQIKLTNFDGLFDSQDVYLEDKQLNIFTNLKLADYSFATQIGTFNDRFVIHFVAPTLSTRGNTITESKLTVIKKQNDIVLKTFETSMKSIAIYDISGRLIYENKNVNNSNYVINNLNSSQQVILVKVTTTTGAVVTEKIVF